MENYPRIKFGKDEYYVIDRFTYKGIEYLYICLDDLGNTEGKSDEELYNHNFVINFIYKLEDGKYSTVENDELFQSLLNFASKRIIQNENPYMNQQ